MKRHDVLPLAMAAVFGHAMPAFEACLWHRSRRGSKTGSIPDWHDAKLSRYITKEQDAMYLKWGADVRWLDPPYGEGYKLAEWVKEAYRESTRGATMVMLIPARTNTRWFNDYYLKYGEARFFRGRAKFGDAEHGLPQPLCFVIFRPTDVGSVGFSSRESPSSVNLLSLFQ